MGNELERSLTESELSRLVKCNVRDLYEGDAWFDSHQANNLLVPGFSHNRFLWNPFQFIVQQSSYHSALIV
jgi:hypothetical protein